jgi:hypothetical protein
VHLLVQLLLLLDELLLVLLVIVFLWLIGLALLGRRFLNGFALLLGGGR